MIFSHKYFSLLMITICSFVIQPDQNNIVVDKKNVTYVFRPFDGPTDHFAKNIFPYWEEETFDIFDQVKNSESIALDLGAWIGTTAIWLSKNFSHVVAVEADIVSLKCLKANLNASECSNITICERPISKTSDTFFFGPQSSNLNESGSCLKTKSTHQQDYLIQGITFKQLIHDFVYENNAIDNKHISFIKCDIEGGEENIIEDMLSFAYHNNIKVFLSFHLSWWKNKDLKRFEYLFQFFKTNCPSTDIINYIQRNPFTSILFEPLKTKTPLIKKDIPAVIIGYNHLTYIKNMVSQLEKYTSDIIIIDNNSDYPPLLDYYAHEFKYTLLKQKTNHGHRVYLKNFIQNLVGDVYILTDPDLKFNENLPNNFIDILLELSNYFKAYKVGFALVNEGEQITTKPLANGWNIKEWDNYLGNWNNKLFYPKDPSLELYKAGIDTTFCLINNQNFNNFDVRIAGNYICLHLPWLKNFTDSWLPGEYEYYMKNNISTSSFR